MPPPLNETTRRVSVLRVNSSSHPPSGNTGRLQVIRYSYPAIAKRIRVAGRKAGIVKPLDFYNLRHSSCVLDKMDNLPVDLAAERHGHGVKHFVGTYGRLSVQDVMRRFHSHYGSGEKEDEKPMIEHQTCPVCKRLNEQAKDWCSSCGTPLNATGARASAVQSGLLGQVGKIPAQEEMAQIKAELAAARVSRLHKACVACAAMEHLL